MGRLHKIYLLLKIFCGILYNNELKEDHPMKLIYLLYQSTEIYHSIRMILFFRLVGVFVSELQTDISVQNYNKKTLSLADVIVNLSGDEANMSGFDLAGKKVINVECKSDEKQSDYDLIFPILKYSRSNNIIDEEEFTDLKAALYVFKECSKDYIEATLLGKYYFEQKSKECIERIYNKYIDVGAQFAKLLQKQKISLWGDNRYIHCRYAFINIFFEMDLFCKKNNIDYYMDIDSMIQACLHIEKESTSYLGNSFKMLRAQICDSLSENILEAFQLYVECCDNSYDSYVYFCKAEMMYKKKELDRAINYYRQSIVFYPQYYRAWFKLGMCYLEKNDERNEARDCFERVVKILKNKADNNLLRAIEYEYYYNSYLNIINIDRMCGDFRRALNACERAFMTYKGISENRFYLEIGIDLINYQQVKEDILSHLDVSKLKKYGIELSTMFDLKDNAMLYAKL